jgi:hypothetical protein
MKPIRHHVIGAALTVLLALSYTAAQAKNVVEKKAYMFGFSASFNDSIVYFTNIQEVDSVWFTQKKSMLAGRSHYSNQLREYCNDKLNQPKRTCIVVGSKKLKKVEKKYEKMKKMYTQSKKTTYDVRFIPEEDFKFETVNMSQAGGEIVPTKADKKKAKAPKGAPKGKDGKMPPPPKK